MTRTIMKNVSRSLARVRVITKRNSTGGDIVTLRVASVMLAMKNDDDALREKQWIGYEKGYDAGYKHGYAREEVGRRLAREPQK